LTAGTKRELPLSNPMRQLDPLSVIAAFRSDLKPAIQEQRRLMAR
jgi:hypothetical protein